MTMATTTPTATTATSEIFHVFPMADTPFLFKMDRPTSHAAAKTSRISHWCELAKPLPPPVPPPLPQHWASKSFIT